MMKTVHVVAGIIFSADRQQVLIARRPDHLHMGGLWEFPGGKVEAGEAVFEALVRELSEELSIVVEEAHHFMEVTHSYPDKQVYLDFWAVHTFSGEPQGAEGQIIAWVTLAELQNYPFPDANIAVVSRLIDRA